MMDENTKSSAEMWDRRFGLDEYAYGRKPNQWLKSRIEKMIPDSHARALFPADGEGRNAVWAAAKGWNAEVFDLSKEGKKKCLQLAKEHDVTVGYQVDDLVLRSFDNEEYDLIACSWFHTPSVIRKRHMPRMLHSLKPGGHFVMEGYHKSQFPLTSGGPKSLDLLFDLDEILAEMTGEQAPQMRVIHASVETTNLNESKLHRGDAWVVRLHLTKT
jgi:hypothetical protein